MTTDQYPPPPHFDTPAGYAYQPSPPQNKGFGIASMVLGIIALVLAFIPIIGVISFVLGLAALGLGIFAVIKHKGKGQGIAGIITGAAALLVAIVVTVLTSAFFSAVDQGFQDFEENFPTEVEEIAQELDSDEEAPAEGAENPALPTTPQAYSALTIIGDEDALPVGPAGEVSVVAISEPQSNTSFPFILQNQTDQAISRVEVSGRALDANEETLGTGASHSVYPNVVLPGGYAFGYVYVDSSEMSLPEGASIPELRIDFTEGLGSFENIISLDIENYEELANGDLTGDVSNPHDEAVGGPIGIDTVCVSSDERVTHGSAYADNDTVDTGQSSTWTLSSYRDTPECVVRLIGARGFN